MAAKKKTSGPSSRPAVKRDYSAVAREYAEQVVAGEIPACKWVRLACERHLRDLERTDWPYSFDPERANRVCKIVELLPHIEGTWKSPTIELEPWQCFILCNVFGWVDREGLRRFRTVYIEVPRKNAKSTLSACVGLVLLAADGEPGAQVYSAATTREQAHAVWGPAKKMVERTEGLRRAFGVEPNAHSISVTKTASMFKPLASEANSLDGLNIHCAIIDELHAHKTRAVWDVLNSATGARKQPLLWAITTAGFNRAGVCYEQRGYLTKVLDGVHEDDTYFGLIYTLDDGDDWTSPESWRKANPNYGVSVLERDIATMARQATFSAQSQNNFLTKRLNVWVNADTSWMNMQAWDACADESLDIADFEGQPCYIGLDLASKIDVAAKVLWFPPHDTRDYGVVFGSYYLPEAAVEQGVNTNSAHYAGWSNDGKMIITPGDATDYDIVIDDIFEDHRRFDVQQVGFDPYQSTPLINTMQKRGLDTSRFVEVGATVRNFSEPMKELEALVLSKRLKHNGDPVLTWMVSNVVAHLDAKDNIYPRKERPENKIDGVVALIMAIGRAQLNQDGPSVYADPDTAVM